MQQAHTIFDYLSTSIYFLGPLAVIIAIAFQWGLRVRRAVKTSNATPDKFSPRYFWLRNRWEMAISFVVGTTFGLIVIFFYGTVQLLVSVEIPWPEYPTVPFLFLIGWYWEPIADKISLSLDMSNEDALKKMNEINKGS